MIDGCDVDRQTIASFAGAFVTFVVGILAVKGAKAVGIKQAGITERQAEIMSRQVALEEASYKAGLFERRLAVFEAAQRYMGKVVVLGTDHENQEDLKSFGRTFQESRFLFGPEVFIALDEILTKADESRFAQFKLRTDMHLLEDARTDLQHIIITVGDWMAERSRTLHEVFSSDLKLSTGPAGPGF